MEIKCKTQTAKKKRKIIRKWNITANIFISNKEIEYCTNILVRNIES